MSMRFAEAVAWKKETQLLSGWAPPRIHPQPPQTTGTSPEGCQKNSWLCTLLAQVRESVTPPGLQCSSFLSSILYSLSRNWVITKQELHESLRVDSRCSSSYQLQAPPSMVALGKRLRGRLQPFRRRQTTPPKVMDTVTLDMGLPNAPTESKQYISMTTLFLGLKQDYKRFRKKALQKPRLICRPG